MEYMIITETFNNGVERWYHGTFNSKERANEIAYLLGSDPEARIYHIVIPANEAEEWGVKNLPYMKQNQ